MAARKTRVNFTLSPDNVRAAQEICEERGLKLSTFVDRAIAAHVKQLREPAKAPGTPGDGPSIDYKRWESQVTGLIPRALETYLEGHYGENDLKRLFEMWTAEAIERATPPPPTPPADAPTSTPKASSSARQATVDIPPEVRDRLQRFSVPQLVEATGMDRSNVSRFRSGSRSRCNVVTFNKLLAGLEKLEATSE